MQLLTIKAGGTYIYHQAVKDYVHLIWLFQDFVPTVD
jgi:hypothetical protein